MIQLLCSFQVVEPIPMDTRETQEGISLEESLSEFEKIEKQYDMLQEELGFSLSSETTSEEQKWISPRSAVTDSEKSSDVFAAEVSSVGDDLKAVTSSEKDSDEPFVKTEEINEEEVAESSEIEVKNNQETKENISTTISKLTPTREIDLLKELELMEQEVSTMKKVVDEVEANVESRKAKIAELVDSAGCSDVGNNLSADQVMETKSGDEQEEESVNKSEGDSEANEQKTNVVPFVVTGEPVEIARYVPIFEDEKMKARIAGVTVSESTTDDVSKTEQEAPSVVHVAGVTASESTTDMEIPSSESDTQVNDIMTKSLSQTFDLVSLQSLQENVKAEPFTVTGDVDISSANTETELRSKLHETGQHSNQRPTTFGAEEILTRDAPLASVESEVDDELMRTSSSNASPDDPVGNKADDAGKDVDEEPDSTTSESIVESSVKSEVNNQRPYKRFRDTFPVHVSTIAHITPEPPKLVAVPEKKKPEPRIAKPVAETKAEAKPQSKTKKEPDSRSKRARDTKRAEVNASKPAHKIPTMGEKLKVERHDGRPMASEHGLKPVQREPREKRSKSPVDLGIVPAAGGGLQAIGEIVAAAARSRSKLNASIEEDAIKRIDNMLLEAKERREKRMKEKSAAEGKGERRSERRSKEAVSPAASGASSGPQIPPSAARAAVEEHMEALDQLVRESQAAAGITLDESFVNTRDRKKRKRNHSNRSDDSSFTISTPSGSIKSCSSISEIESMPNSHGLSLDKSNSADILGSSTDADVSLSIEHLVDDNLTANDSGFSKSVETTVVSNTTLEESHMSSSHKDSPAFQSANTTVNENSNSEYFTPDVSGVEPMDTNELNKSSSANRPKGLDSRSTASDGKSLDDSLHDSQSSPLYSPRRNLLDAKRNFFFEQSRPVSIDPSRVFTSPTHKSKNNKNDNGRKDRDGNAIEVGAEEFENEKNANNTKNHQASPNKKKIAVDPELLREWKSVDVKESPKKGVMGLDLKRDWQSLDCGTTNSPTAGVPKTNVTNGDSDVFYTPATSLKHGAIVRSDSALKKPTDTKKRVGTELRKIKEDDRDAARQVAREKARLKSDEELGIERLSPTRKAAYTQQDINAQSANGVGKDDAKKGTKEDLGQTKRSSGFFDHYPLEPEIPCKVSIIGGSVYEAKTRSLQNKATAAAMADYLLQSPQSSQSKGNAKDKRSKSKSPMRAAEVPPPPTTLQKQDSKEEKKEKESKEKRRSLLALLLPSKSVEKKDKKPEKEKKSTPKATKNKSPPVKKQEPKSKGVKSPKTSTSPKVPGLSDQAKKLSETQEGQKASVYEELRPVFEENAFTEKKMGKVESKKEKLMERIEQVAPAVSNDKTIAPKLPPRATGKSFIVCSTLAVFIVEASFDY